MIAISVLPGYARVCPFVASRTDRAVAIGFHDRLRNRLGNAAKKIDAPTDDKSDRRRASQDESANYVFSIPL